MRVIFSRFLRDDSGVGAVEYALIASLVAVVITGAVGFVGQSLITIFQNVQNGFAA